MATTRKRRKVTIEYGPHTTKTVEDRAWKFIRDGKPVEGMMSDMQAGDLVTAAREDEIFQLFAVKKVSVE